MEDKTNQNIVNAAIVAAGVLAYTVVALTLESLAGTFGVVARLYGQDAFKHGVPVVSGLITFFVLFMNRKVHVFLDEAVVEVRKVVWPSRKDTVAMTIVCCVMVLIAGTGLGIFDFFSSQLIKMFVN